MSHLEERKEKICLNCKAELYGRYCHVCGQENVEPKETVWHLINHFFQDITHFDGKFFSTVKYLLTKPGFLSLEYIKGRRASYLNPIRMYVFTSAIFFLILFSFSNADDVMKFNEQTENEKKETVADWEKQKIRLLKKLEIARKKNDEDSSNVIDELKGANLKIAAAKKIYGDTTTRKFSKSDVVLLIVQAGFDSLKKEGITDSAAHAIRNKIAQKDSLQKKDGNAALFVDKKYTTPEVYDSIQARLLPAQQDGWFTKIVTRKLIATRNELNKDQNGFIEHFKERFMHSFPKIFFVSLPFFALILQLVYIRRKQFYYTSHGIFTIHIYCATFILLLIVTLLNQLKNIASWKWLEVTVSVLDLAIWLYILIYLYKAMRRFYGQKRFKTFVKYLIVNFLALIVNLIILVIFILISAISF